jgi:hypothetical protein
MFDMFKGGKPNAQDLWVVNKVEREKKLNDLVYKIKRELSERKSEEPLNITSLVVACGLERLSQQEFEWVESQIE